MSVVTEKIERIFQLLDGIFDELAELQRDASESQCACPCGPCDKPAEVCLREALAEAHVLRDADERKIRRLIAKLHTGDDQAGFAADCRASEVEACRERDEARAEADRLRTRLAEAERLLGEVDPTTTTGKKEPAQSAGPGVRHSRSGTDVGEAEHEGEQRSSGDTDVVNESCACPHCWDDDFCLAASSCLCGLDRCADGRVEAHDRALPPHRSAERTKTGADPALVEAEVKSTRLPLKSGSVGGGTLERSSPVGASTGRCRAPQDIEGLGCCVNCGGVVTRRGPRGEKMFSTFGYWAVAWCTRCGALLEYVEGWEWVFVVPSAFAGDDVCAILERCARLERQRDEAESKYYARDEECTRLLRANAAAMGMVDETRGRCASLEAALREWEKVVMPNAGTGLACEVCGAHTVVVRQTRDHAEWHEGGCPVRALLTKGENDDHQSAVVDDRGRLASEERRKA